MSDSMQRMFPNGATVCRVFGNLSDGEVMAAFTWVDDAKDWAQRQVEKRESSGGYKMQYAVCDTNSGRVWIYSEDNVPTAKGAP